MHVHLYTLQCHMLATPVLPLPLLLLPPLLLQALIDKLDGDLEYALKHDGKMALEECENYQQARARVGGLCTVGVCVCVCVCARVLGDGVGVGVGGPCPIGTCMRACGGIGTGASVHDGASWCGAVQHGSAQ